MMRQAAVQVAAALALTALLGGCGDDEEAIIGSPGAPEVGAVTVQSDQSTASVPPLCVGDIPEDLTACPGAPANLGQVELDETRKATVLVPLEVSTAGYRVRLNGVPAPGLDDVINERNVQLRIPVEVVQAPGETILTIEALRSSEIPAAVWEFLLADPVGPPN